MTRRLPLELKLPLLMSVVLAIVLTVVIVATYNTMREFAVERVQDRLVRGSRQLAAASATALASVNVRYQEVADDPAVRSAIRGAVASAPGAPQTGLVHTALRRLVLPTDSAVAVELWAVNGRRVAVVGPEISDSMIVARGKPELPNRIRDVAPLTIGDSIRFGEPYAQGGRAYFWIVLPVRERGRPIGYIAHQRRLLVPPSTQLTLRELSGDFVSLFYRSVEGSLWVSGDGTVLPPMELDTAAGIAVSANGDRKLLHMERIGTTPIMIGLEVPERTVLARPKRSVEWLVWLGSILMLGGVLVSWLIGRSVARPLANVTRAVGSLAEGHYGTRVPETGDHEVRRLATSFNNMAAEIGASRVALERQTQEAQQANNAKSEFLTTMSHELRTPLNAIGGYADLIEMELRGPVTEAQRRDLNRIKTSQQHLLGLISSVLDLARIEAGRVNYEFVNIALDPFLSGIDSLVGPQAAAKSLSLHYAQRVPDLTVVGDREKLRQVLLNLLSNAIKHTPAGGDIAISAEPRGNKIGILVEDTGTGIPRDKRDQIFEPFVQLDRTLSQTRDGIGLGLAISRDLARGMHGDLIVEDGRSTGARFVLLMPAGTFADASMTLSGEMPVGRRSGATKRSDT